MPTMDAKNQAAGQPFALTQALSVFRPGLGTDVSLQLETELDEQRRKAKQGFPADPAQYGGSILSSLGVFGNSR